MLESKFITKYEIYTKNTHTQHFHTQYIYVFNEIWRYICITDEEECLSLRHS